MTSIADLIKSVVLIPGTGEFVYHPYPVLGAARESLNKHADHPFANSVYTIRKMKDYFPNLKKVAIVVGWFGDSLDAEQINIAPKVEHKSKYAWDQWRVANYTRDNAHEVSKCKDISNWGGTPSDNSMLELAKLLKSIEIEVALYPFLYLDLPGKPWRGDIHSTSEQGIIYFLNQYKEFITHYASLLKGYIDLFSIGSELVGINEFKTAGGYPSIDKLIELSSEVREIVGDGCQITYGANWGSEYHHNKFGERPLDKLWASNNIDTIGIDAYFPLTENLPSHQITYSKIYKGWTSGEGYDYWLDGEGNKNGLSLDWAIKAIKHWWETEHWDSNGKTPWVPESKNITITEFGCAAIDACTNKPNVFVDATTEYSQLPPKSNGHVDHKIQAMAIQASLEFFDVLCQATNEKVACDAFVYAVDARPEEMLANVDYKTIWADAGKIGGHEVQVALVDQMGPLNVEIV